MRIIREGDLSRLSTVRRFVCSDCGCVFEASGCEYLRTTLGGKMICECSCPTCRKVVRIKDEEGGTA